MDAEQLSSESIAVKRCNEVLESLLRIRAELEVAALRLESLDATTTTAYCVNAFLCDAEQTQGYMKSWVRRFLPDIDKPISEIDWRPSARCLGL